ncbi:MAG: lipopolysaccharide/colanic/teichoic acid biosynthesis glycosyltransferase [Yoonia sp.]|jgi:exopolysaccharide production protein ExoY
MTFYSTDSRVQDDRATAILVTPKLRPSLYRKIGKRALDLVLLLMTAPIMVPLIAIMTLAVLLTGATPIYVQERVGLNGKTFRMWKLRTMLPNAEEHLKSYLAKNPEARAEWDSKQKLLNDPRITPIGSFLRKTSLDELPQLLNVLTGSMSLVGPRPMMLDQKEQYTGTAYYRQRPGMTGLWQISDRNSSKFVDRVQFDEIYSRKLSLNVDIYVILRTVVVMLRRTGC